MKYHTKNATNYKERVITFLSIRQNATNTLHDKIYVRIYGNAIISQCLGGGGGVWKENKIFAIDSYSTGPQHVNSTYETIQLCNHIHMSDGAVRKN